MSDKRGVKLPFHLFSGEAYYPIGGMGDYRGAYPTLEAAKDSFGDSAEWGDIAVVGMGGHLETVAEYEIEERWEILYDEHGAQCGEQWRVEKGWRSVGEEA